VAAVALLLHLWDLWNLMTFLYAARRKIWQQQQRLVSAYLFCFVNGLQFATMGCFCKVDVLSSCDNLIYNMCKKQWLIWSGSSYFPNATDLCGVGNRSASHGKSLAEVINTFYTVVVMWCDAVQMLYDVKPGTNLCWLYIVNCAA